MEMLHIQQLLRDVSRLGMGSMIFSPDNRGLVFDLLDRFRELGGNLIDTAEVYGGGGRSEQAIGLYLLDRGCRKKVIIIDKGCERRENVTPEGVRRAITVNLGRLGTQYIDVWTLHRDNPEAPVDGIVETLNDEVAKGRIRAFGGSNWTVERIAEANEYASRHGLTGMCLSSPNVCLAVPNEPWWQDCTHATEADIAWAAKRFFPLVAWSSQGRGFFLDDCSPDNLENKDLVRVYHSPENFKRLARARKLADAYGLTAIQIALAYVLSLAPTTIALVGPATVEQVESCVQASETKLSEAEMKWLNLKLSDEEFEAQMGH